MIAVFREKTNNQNDDQHDQVRSSGKLVSIRILLLIAISLVMNLIDASAGTVKLSWDYVDATNIAGYSIYYGSKENNYHVSVPLKELANQKEPSYTVKDIKSGEPYYFAVSVDDPNGNQQLVSAGVKNIAQANDSEIKELLLKFSEKLSQFENSVNPKGAVEILNVARMKQEILAREEYQKTMTQKFTSFDDNISKVVTAFESRILNTENRIDNLLYWILGGLIAIIGGLTYIVNILLKNRLSDTGQVPGEGLGRTDDGGGH